MPGVMVGPLAGRHGPRADAGGADPFRACGEMASFLAGLDGSRTPLGSPAAWPDNLRVTAGVCLASPLPTQLWWGPDLCLLYNAAHIPFLGSGRHPGALGRPLREVCAEMWERVAAVAGQVLASGVAGWAPDVPVTLDGSPARVGISVSPVPGHGGGVDGLVLTAHEPVDTLALQAARLKAARLEDELREARQAVREIEGLREADRQKDAFLATLAHELRNPLAPILNALQIMRAHASADPMLSQARGMIERQTGQLVCLVDDLMEIARIRRGRIQLQLQRVDLASAIATAVESSRLGVDAAGHTLIVDLPPHPLPMEGDPARLSQIFANLLNNAVRYTPGRGRIELSAHVEGAGVEGGEAVVCVKDSGVGIPRAMLGRIFELFAQADPSPGRSQGGLGIGLTVAQQLARLHGGHIEAHSAGPGEGSTFAVHLPLLRTPGREPPVQSAGSGEGVRGAVTRRVLVADDNADAAESLCILLTMAGHTVRTAGDGLAAVQLAQEFEPEAVLLDIGMPVLNGYEAATRIRALPNGERILLIALTGWGQDSDRQKAAEAGFDYHLTKPADPEVLERILADGSPA